MRRKEGNNDDKHKRELEHADIRHDQEGRDHQEVVDHQGNFDQEEEFEDGRIPSSSRDGVTDSVTCCLKAQVWRQRAAKTDR